MLYIDMIIYKGNTRVVYITSGFDNWDIDHTKYMLIMGSNILETHTNHMSVAHRIMHAKVDRGVPMKTFDVRMSNTAAKSDE